MTAVLIADKGFFFDANNTITNRNGYSVEKCTPKTTNIYGVTRDGDES